MRAILNIGLQHHLFTSLSPIGKGSEKAFAPDFDCAWGEKMRIGPERVGPVPKVRASWAWWLAGRSGAAAG